MAEARINSAKAHCNRSFHDRGQEVMQCQGMPIAIVYLSIVVVILVQRAVGSHKPSRNHRDKTYGKKQGIHHTLDKKEK